MANDTISKAEFFLRNRKFESAVNLLESKARCYEDDFQYYYLLGTAYLYSGDTGNALKNYAAARKLRLTDVNMLLGQAVIFLKRGDTGRAINYYIDILDNDPNNKTALAAMDFIKDVKDYDTICRWNDSGRIEKFYPPIGISFSKVAGIVFPVIACVLGFVFVFSFLHGKIGAGKSQDRADLSSLYLTLDERHSLLENDISSGSFKYILTPKEISSSYEKAHYEFQHFHDNLAQIEINKILNSNASVSIKEKTRQLMEYLDEPGFDSIKDVPDFQNVQSESSLYLDCWVVWSGRISNVYETETTFECSFLVGYETMQKIEGVVPLVFDVKPSIIVDKPITVLAKISVRDGKLILKGKSVYQSPKDSAYKFKVQ